MTKQFYDNPVLLEDVFISLRDLGILSSCCSSWTATVMRDVIHPVLSDPFKWKLSLKKTKLVTSLSLEPVATTGAIQGGETKLGAALDSVLQVCRFIHTHVFRAPPVAQSHSPDTENENDTLPIDHPMHVFGTQMATVLINSITQDLIYPGIPTDLGSLDKFAKEAVKCLTFEEEVRGLGGSFFLHFAPGRVLI